ncbi:hypothetical protein CFAEC_13695 (plasmid) [Corynebacterium faecale]|nr:hypothetical protein CFAEC_13695 [Corynebacterium faecale]
MFTPHSLRSLRTTSVVLTLFILIGFMFPAPSANAQNQHIWTNCGDYTCTTYFSKKGTQAVAEYLNSTAGAVGTGAESAVCFSIMSPLLENKQMLPAFGVEVGCEALFDKYGVSAWKKAAQRAVDRGGCLQAEKKKNGFIYKPGSTTHPRYCKS